MPETKPHSCAVAIVGGGCSGLLVAVQLFRNGFRERVVIIEPREQLGGGLAYSTAFNQHLLNVPAGKMSALPGQPSHFLEWLRAGHRPDAGSDSFAPRRIYGEYLCDLLQQTIRTIDGDRFAHIRAEAIELSVDGKGGRLTLSNGRTVQAGRVVLAVGNPASSSVHAPSREGLEDHWHLSPWFGNALHVRFPGERVLVLGSGLTAVDAALALQSQKAACEVYMVSRRGILPAVHNLSIPAGVAPAFRNRGRLHLLLREVREQIEISRDDGRRWRTVVDALRPISNDVWRELPLADRKRFQRHLKRYWEPHRHRMAPEIRARLDRYLAAGKLKIFAGKLAEICSRSDGNQCRIRLKCGGEQILEVHRIISCTGIHEDYSDSPRAPIRSMMKAGLATANDLGSGFRTDSHGALLDAQMTPSSVFFTLGPPRRGELFETTAVPEIRVQAEELALHLAALKP